MSDDATALGEGGRPGHDPQFWGTHEHTLDTKGRLILPSRFREPFRTAAYITKLTEGCLAVWTQTEFERRTAAMLEMARQGQAQRNVARAWAAGAHDSVPDGQGRLAIPTHLRSWAELDGEVIVNGVINHLEIWSPARWAAIDAEGSQFLMSGTDALADIGF